MALLGSSKPHIVCVPYPSQGHVSPMMHLAKFLHSRAFYITFVNTEFNHNSLIRSKRQDFVKGLPDFRFQIIPEGLPPSDRNATQDVPALCDSTWKNCLATFKELLNLNSLPEEVPPVTFIISDGMMSFGIKAGEDLGIPEVQFWTASACSFIGYLHFDVLLYRGIIPFKGESFLHDGTLDTPIDCILGLKDVRLKDLPSFIRTLSADDIMFDFMRSEARKGLKSSAIIINTFDEFEHEALEAISAMFPNIYTIGPHPLLGRHVTESNLKSLSSSLWKEDSRMA